MREIGRLALLAILIAAPHAETVAGPPCPRLARHYGRLAELPPGAAAALGFPIAERGAPWNATDAIDPRQPLLFDRFISAQSNGCALTIVYEHGGFAHVVQSVTLSLRGGRWTRIQRR